MNKETHTVISDEIVWKDGSPHFVVQKNPPKIQLDYSKIEDVYVDGIDGRDAPDFCDAYIASATYEGREMTDEELEVLNEDSDYVYECLERQIY